MTQTIEDAVFNSQASLQMTDFLSGLHAEVERSRQMLALSEARFIEKKAMCDAFPSTLPMAPYAINLDSHKADAELVFEVTTREEVLQLLTAFPGLPALMLKSGCTSFIAEERFTGPETGTTVVPIGEVVYRLAHWVDTPQEEYMWWTHLAGKLVHVLAKTKKGHFVCAKVSSTVKSLTPALQEVTYNYEKLPRGIVTTWNGGSLKSMAPVTVHQPRGSHFRDAVATSMVASAKVHARHCDC